MSGFILQDAVSDHAFSLEEVDFSSISDEDELLKIAIGFEQDSIAFYEIMESFVSDAETLKHVQRIQDEERRHIALLEDRRRRIAG